MFSLLLICYFFFFFNDTATTEIYTLSLHDALPISANGSCSFRSRSRRHDCPWRRSEEHTSELQSRVDLVCRLLLEKKKNTTKTICAPNKKKKDYDVKIYNNLV